VAAVAGTGALGTLAASWTEPARLRSQIRQIRATLEGPFCVNLVLAFDQRERVELSLEEGVALVSFSWGVDDELISCAHRAGAGFSSRWALPLLRSMLPAPAPTA
jgi:nitronate monooxygenase